MTSNLILDALPPDELAALRPALVRRTVSKGEVLIRQGSIVREVHFPVTADIANVLILVDGAVTEISSVGRDGVTGLAAFLADAPIGWEAVVRTAGEVMAVSADLLRAHVRGSPRMLELLLRVTHHNQIESGQIGACNTHHAIEQRMARWLLTLADRTGGDRMEVTQEDLAEALGVRRTSVTSAAVGLKADGSIRYSRGVIVIDHPALEQHACDCYAALAQRRREGGVPLA